MAPASPRPVSPASSTKVEVCRSAPSGASDATFEHNGTRGERVQNDEIQLVEVSRKKVRKADEEDHLAILYHESLKEKEEVPETALAEEVAVLRQRCAILQKMNNELTERAGVYEQRVLDFFNLSEKYKGENMELRCQLKTAQMHENDLQRALDGKPPSSRRSGIFGRKKGPKTPDHGMHVSQSSPSFALNMIGRQNSSSHSDVTSILLSSRASPDLSIEESPFAYSRLDDRHLHSSQGDEEGEEVQGGGPSEPDKTRKKTLWMRITSGLPKMPGEFVV